jgi:serine/threonine-protein kinase
MSLNHSNIVHVLDLGQSKGRYFLVMELVDGWDLNHLLTRMKNAGHPLRPELAMYIAAEVCRALAYAHSRMRDGQALGIVHRDVSPHNVLISDQGEVKLTDFGIAKALGRRERTGAGVIKGKLAFMSPEQASGLELDSRSDLFSVGTMLYLMFAGRRPFDAATDLETILRVQQCDFPPPSKVKPDIPPEIERIITRAMKRNPVDRYQTGDEMLRDVEAAQRSVFRPANQTELRQWLVELGQKDQLPTISRSQPPPAQPDEEDVDLHEDIVFEAAIGDTLPPMSTKTSSAIRRAAMALDGALAASPAKDTRVDPQPAGAAPRPGVRPSRRRWLLAGLVVGAAGAAGMAALLRPRETLRVPASLDDQPAPTPPPIATTPPPTSPVPAATGSDAAPIVQTAPPATGTDAAVAAARADTAPAVAAEGEELKPTPLDEPPAPEEEDEDEEKLFEQRDPDIANKVIGEEAGTPAPPPPRPRPSPGTSRPPPSSAREPISVRVESRPVGAVIHIGRHVLGRAPMNLKFNSGITYELTFVKGGYATAKKRFTVSGRKGQVVGINLRKRAPAPPGSKRRNFFQRLFGG